jgi:hypothetical protein
MKLPHRVNRTRSKTPGWNVRPGRRATRLSIPGRLDQLERRELPATFLVSNLDAMGAGSLRQAILASNETPGPNTIDFGVSGTISIGHGSLPAITNPVTIDGTSAPSFQGSPVVTVDFEGTEGLQFAPGSDWSTLESLALVDAGDAGVTLSASSVTVRGNYIGLLADGRTVAGNGGDGLRINASSRGDLIGQVTPSSSFALSNVISGNGGNGIGIYGGKDNSVAMNYIGTDASGTVALGNGQNGILITKGASGNLIGGTASGGNDPTGGVFVRPPQGNLISGNRANGVLIDGRATRNTLSGNFVGTAASGNSTLGNRLDGVAIVGANGNQLIGCTLTDQPFVYYNVISGNGGNGLRITDSNDTVVHANFLGVGANNGTIVANGGDGLLVSGSSKQTQVGGVIPLGNVIAGNNLNGIEVKDKASGFTSFNTFAGLYAFLGAAPNKLDGILITSTGGNNLIRTCIVSGNDGDGIELGGNATGVQVEDTAVGTTTNIETKLPNGGSGIVISGTAHGNTIGGFQASVEQQDTVSSNLGYGIEVIGRAHDNSIFHTNVGTGGLGVNPLPNALGGIYLGPGTSKTTLGGPSIVDRDFIENNQGAGLTIDGSNGNKILGSMIADNVAGGVVVTDGRDNQIGVPGAGNEIMSNGQDGLSITGDATGTKVQSNTIAQNASNGVALVNAHEAKIGGATGLGNQIVSNAGYGIFTQGQNAGTKVVGNLVVGNGQGNTNSGG